MNCSKTIRTARLCTVQINAEASMHLEGCWEECSKCVDATSTFKPRQEGTARHELFCDDVQVAPKKFELLGMSPETLVELPAFSVTIIATSSDDSSAAAAA